MRIPVPILLLSIAVVVACSEGTTAPKSYRGPADLAAVRVPIDDFVILSDASRQPPPPLDTNYVSATTGGTTSGASNFFVNKTGNNAWVTFGDGAAPTGRIHFKNNGTIQGTGTLGIIGNDGVPTTIDLANTHFGFSTLNAACATPPLGSSEGKSPPCATVPFTATGADGAPIFGTLGIGVPAPRVIIGDGGPIG